MRSGSTFRNGLFSSRLESKTDVPFFRVKQLDPNNSLRVHQHFKARIAVKNFFLNAGENEIHDPVNPAQSQKINLSDAILCYEPKSHPGTYHFRVYEKRIGGGEFGEVYRLAGKLKPIENGELVFIKADAKICKEINISDDFTIEDSENEAAIAKVTELSAKDLIVIDLIKKAFLVEDLLPGKSLFDFISEINHQQRLVSFTDREHLWEELVYTVMKLHGLGIVHGDLQPDNFLISELDDLFYIHVVDHGFSRFNANTKLRLHSGTIGYMAPEILDCGITTYASDIYSTGVVGSLFFGAGTPDILDKEKSEITTPLALLNAKNYHFPHLFENLDIAENSRFGFKHLFDQMVATDVNSRGTMEKIWDETQNIILERRLKSEPIETRAQYKKAFLLAAKFRKEFLSDKSVTKDLIQKITDEVADNWPPFIYQMFCRKLHQMPLLRAKSKAEILDCLNLKISEFELAKRTLEVKYIDLEMLSETFEVKQIKESCLAIKAKCHASSQTPEQIKTLTAKLNKRIASVNELFARLQPPSERASFIRRSL